MITIDMFQHGGAIVKVAANSNTECIVMARIIWDSFEPEVWISARP